MTFFGVLVDLTAMSCQLCFPTHMEHGDVVVTEEQGNVSTKENARRNGAY